MWYNSLKPIMHDNLKTMFLNHILSWFGVNFFDYHDWKEVLY